MVYLDPYLLLPWQQPLGVHAIVYAELFFPLIHINLMEIYVNVLLGITTHQYANQYA